MMTPKSLAPVITVDGPSGVGKGTTASLLSNHLGWHLLDSGAIYRSLALKVLKTETEVSENIDTLVHLALNLNLRFESITGKPATYLDNALLQDFQLPQGCL